MDITGVDFYWRERFFETGEAEGRGPCGSWSREVEGGVRFREGCGKYWGKRFYWKAESTF